MRSWLLRGLVLAFLMVLIRLIQGALINMWETSAGTISAILVLIFIIAPLAWGYIDGRRDALAQPDPDRRADLAMTWLLAGLSAGIISGFVCWLISLFYESLYVGGLVSELTTFAAFTALLVFVCAMLTVGISRFLVDRNAKNQPVRRHHGLAAGEDDNPDTDVFAAVNSDDRTQEQRVK